MPATNREFLDMKPPYLETGNNWQIIDGIRWPNLPSRGDRILCHARSLTWGLATGALLVLSPLTLPVGVISTFAIGLIDGRESMREFPWRCPILSMITTSIGIAVGMVGVMS